jgi:hypothetical protein
VRSIIVARWSGFNTPLHALAHALNPKFYDEELFSKQWEKERSALGQGGGKWSEESLPKVVSSFYTKFKLK